MVDRAPVVLLHGQPGSAEDWDGVRARLDPGVTVIAPDRPGWDGRSRPAGLEGNARAVIAALDGAGSDGAIVVGHSLGATIAAWLAAHRPERVRALILAAPAANTASLYALDRWMAAPVAGELSAAISLGSIGLALAVGPVRRRLAAVTGVPPEYLQHAGARIRRPLAWWAYSAEQRALVRGMSELESRLAAIRAPTQILAGTADRIVPEQATVALSRQIPGARLEMLDGAGHLLPQTQPDALAGAIRAALDAP